jgi:hypothetical protein
MDDLPPPKPEVRELSDATPESKAFSDAIYSAIGLASLAEKECPRLQRGPNYFRILKLYGLDEASALPKAERLANADLYMNCVMLRNRSPRRAVSSNMWR